LSTCAQVPLLGMVYSFTWLSIAKLAENMKCNHMYFSFSTTLPGKDFILAHPAG